MREVAEKHKMTIRKMKGDSRKIQFVKARQEAAYRLRLELNYSLPQIGRLLGKRDHTTILHAIRRHEKNLAQGTEPWTRQVVSERCDEGITAAQQIVD
jgi:chromosomal replication initiator protein